MLSKIYYVIFDYIAIVWLRFYEILEGNDITIKDIKQSDDDMIYDQLLLHYRHLFP